MNLYMRWSQGDKPRERERGRRERGGGGEREKGEIWGIKVSSLPCPIYLIRFLHFYSHVIFHF